MLIKSYSIMFSVIENLPMEMRDKFTEMREMDLQVSSKGTLVLTLRQVFMQLFVWRIAKLQFDD